MRPDDASLLRELVELESPTGNRAGVRAVAERVAGELEPLGASVRFRGDHLVAELDGDGELLLVLGHTDTVWPLGTLEAVPFRIADGRAYGPGTFDMKGGLVLLAAALKVAGAARRPVRVFLTADEERGSLTARDLLRDAAAGVAAALVLEPPTPGGALKTARKGLRRYRLVIEGRAAHAGSANEGASAIEELAHQVLRLKALSDRGRGISVNVGVVRGGTESNVVAEHAEARIDVRVAHAAAAAALDEALGSVQPVLEGTHVRLEEAYARPPPERSAGSQRCSRRPTGTDASWGSTSVRPPRAAAPTATSSERSASPCSTASAPRGAAPTPAASTSSSTPSRSAPASSRVSSKTRAYNPGPTPGLARDRLAGPGPGA